MKYAITSLQEAVSYDANPSYKENLTPEEFNKIVDMDPTPTKKYGRFLVENFIKVKKGSERGKNVIDALCKGNEFDTDIFITEPLRKFDEWTKSDKYIKGGFIPSKDLNVCLSLFTKNNPDAVRNMVKGFPPLSLFVDEVEHKIKNNTDINDIELPKDSYKIVYRDKEWVLVQIFSHEASVFFGRKGVPSRDEDSPQTCVSREQSESYDKYMEQSGSKLFYLRHLPLGREGLCIFVSDSNKEISDLQNTNIVDRYKRKAIPPRVYDFPIPDNITELIEKLTEPKGISKVISLIGDFQTMKVPSKEQFNAVLSAISEIPKGSVITVLFPNMNTLGIDRVIEVYSCLRTSGITFDYTPEYLYPIMIEKDLSKIELILQYELFLFREGDRPIETVAYNLNQVISYIRNSASYGNTDKVHALGVIALIYKVSCDFSIKGAPHYLNIVYDGLGTLRDSIINVVAKEEKKKINTILTVIFDVCASLSRDGYRDTQLQYWASRCLFDNGVKHSDWESLDNLFRFIKYGNIELKGWGYTLRDNQQDPKIEKLLYEWLLNSQDSRSSIDFLISCLKFIYAFPNNLTTDAMDYLVDAVITKLKQSVVKSDGQEEWNMFVNRALSKPDPEVPRQKEIYDVLQLHKIDTPELSEGKMKTLYYKGSDHPNSNTLWESWSKNRILQEKKSSGVWEGHFYPKRPLELDLKGKHFSEFTKSLDKIKSLIERQDNDCVILVNLQENRHFVWDCSGKTIFNKQLIH